jgi:hypothetical protein
MRKARERTQRPLASTERPPKKMRERTQRRQYGSRSEHYGPLKNAKRSHPPIWQPTQRLNRGNATNEATGVNACIAASNIQEDWDTV